MIVYGVLLTVLVVSLPHTRMREQGLCDRGWLLSVIALYVLYISGLLYCVVADGHQCCHLSTPATEETLQENSCGCSQRR